MSPGFIPPHGGYEGLHSYKKALIVFLATSKQTEIHLTNVARASLEELKEDYRDFLRLRRLPVWPKDSPRMLALRALGTDAATYEPQFPRGVTTARRKIA